MKTLCFAIIVSAALSTTQTALAQRGGFIQQLPKDGSWVSYYLSMENEQAPAQNASGVITIRSVGTETVNGEKCRWVELEMDIDANNKKQKNVVKLLLREKDLQPNAKSPLKVIRGWFKENEKDVRAYDDSKQGEKDGVEAFFGQKLKDVKTVKKEKVVDYQQGQVKVAEAHVGKFTVNQANPNVQLQQTITQTVWKHKKIPFGTAVMEMQIEVKQKDNVVANMTMTFNVKDHGTGAKSSLPDKK